MATVTCLLGNNGNGGSALTFYTLQRRTGTGSWATIAEPAASATSYLDSTAVAGTQYGYRLAVSNSVGMSPFTAEATITPTEGGANVVTWRGLNAFGGDARAALSGHADTGSLSTSDGAYNYSNALPGTYGTHYLFDSLASLQFYYGRGHRLIRMPFRWERLQPTLGAAFNAEEQARIAAFLDNAATAGLKVIVEPHNYGSYWLHDGSGGTRRQIGDPAGPTVAHWQDFWTRMVAAFGGKSALLGYDLMNEPTNEVAVSGGFTSQSTLHEFTDVTNWQGNTGTTITQATWQTASALKATRTAAGQFQIYAPFVANTDRSAFGAVFKPRIWIDSTTTTGWQGRIDARHGADISVTGATVTLPVGQWTELPEVTLTAVQLADFKRVFLQVEHASAVGSVYVDWVRQGAAAGNKTDAQVWQTHCQEAYDAIRAAEGGGTRRWVIAPTYAFSNAYRVHLLHAAPWLTEVTGETQVAYTVHHYWDHQGGGATAISYDDEVTKAQNGVGASSSTYGGPYTASGGNDALTVRILAELDRVKTWAGTKKILIGEYGIYCNRPATEQSQWVALADKYLARCDTHGFWATNWASGEWWSDGQEFEDYYRNTTGGAMNVVHNAQVAGVIEAHPSF